MPSFAEVIVNSISNSTPLPDSWANRLEGFLNCHGAWSILIALGIVLCIFLVAFIFYLIYLRVSDLWNKYISKKISIEVERKVETYYSSKFGILEEELKEEIYRYYHPNAPRKKINQKESGETE